MGLPLPLATCLSWVGPPSNLGGGSARAVFLLVSQSQGRSVGISVDLLTKNWKGRSRSYELRFEFQPQIVQSMDDPVRPR